jgi:hypothetical protein
MIKTAILPAIALVITCGGAQAQNTYHWPAPSQPAAGSAQYFHLQSGTPLVLRTTSEINTKDKRPGDRVYLEVAESVMFRGQVIIPAGAPAMGEIARAQRNGHFGKKGKLQVRLMSVQTPQGPVRLTGSAYDEGKSGTVASVATIALVSPLGFLIHGTSGKIMPGTMMTANLAQPLQFAYTGPQFEAAANSTPVQPDAPWVAEPGISAIGASQGVRGTN